MKQHSAIVCCHVNICAVYVHTRDQTPMNLYMQNKNIKIENLQNTRLLNLWTYNNNLHIGEWRQHGDWCHLQMDNLKDLDLYNLLPNPDKSDDADPDHILINSQFNYYAISSSNKVLSKSGAKAFSFLYCNIRSLSKNIGLLEDMLYSFKWTAWCIMNFWNQAKCKYHF